MTAVPEGRDELSRTLRDLRQQAGMKGAEIARRTGFSEAKVSRFLHGQVVPGPDDARAMVQAMGMVDTDGGRRAVELATGLKEGLASRHVLLREGGALLQRRWGEIERSSGHVQTFTNTIVPGLLQTPAYARSVFSADGDEDPAEVEAAVEGRAARQQLLHDADHQFTLVMTEGALRWQARDPQLMAEQCDQIATFAWQLPSPRVRIGIIPWTTAVDTFPMSGINLYDERAVIIGTDSGTSIITTPGDVAGYVRRFRHLCDLAAYGPDAAAIADRIAVEYHELG